ncbi:hypothetical protein PsorP6_009594 [Peronosclerospora sorghi]|uniref:Uncharacterized protein n=1 Tax=Peronosclerospora sorghi TaxID=230839 RepID=A0ACC0W238_9STRA|nr:hypothetical protein PsorP6_009594 [Peronosclerospora sorghi]
MWLFVGISLALATPSFRAWLEALFAELSIIFFTYLGLVSLGLGFIFMLTLVYHGRRFLQTRGLARRSNMGHSFSDTTPRAPPARAPPRVHWTRRASFLVCVKTTTSDMAGSGLYVPQLWTCSLVALALLPLIHSVMLGAGREMSARTLSTRRQLKSETATALAVESAALVSLQHELTACKYSKETKCLNDVTAISVLGEHRQASGYCTAFDAAYVNGTRGTVLPAQYFPIAVDDAYAQGFANDFAAWTRANQERFQKECPLLYNETIRGHGHTLLCCTETQYERLSLELRAVPGHCPACTDNLRNVWCQLTCHPSNSLFLDVTQVRLLAGDARHAEQVFPAIEEATYYVGSDVVRDLHDFCARDAGARPLLCNTTEEDEDTCSTTGLDLLNGLATSTLGGLGFPSHVNFVTMEQLSTAEQQATICECSAVNTSGCFAPLNTRLESCVGVCGSLCAVDATDRREYKSACYLNGSTSTLEDGNAPASIRLDSTDRADRASKIRTLVSDLSSRAHAGNFSLLNYALAVLAVVATMAVALGYAYTTRYGKRKRQSVLDDPAHRSRRTGGILSLPTIEQAKIMEHRNDWLSQHFKRWGDFVAMGNHPLYIILLSLMISVCCSWGLVRLEVETDPMKLWTSESSTVYQEQARFNALLGPLDRVEHLVLAAKDGGPVIRPAYLNEAIRLQQLVATDIVAGNITLRDICVKDAGSSACHINAATQFFQNNLAHFQVYATYNLVNEHLNNCANAPERPDVDVCSKLRARLRSSETALPASMSECPCLSSFGAPMTHVRKYLGGKTGRDASLKAGTNLEQATALYSTALVMNSWDPVKNADAIAWERMFLQRMEKEARTNALFDIFYAAETSAHDEGVRASNGSAVFFKASGAGFLAMFVFVGIGLYYRKLHHDFFHSSRIGVGLLGVACSVLSVSATLGILAWTGVKLQVVTLVVLPLLVLAMGTGNIFLILSALDLKQQELKMEQRSLFVELEDNDFGIHEITCVLLCEATGHVGPSIVTTAACACGILAVTTYSAMPAAQWLAGSLVVAMAANVALQFTLFLAIVALDKRRELSGTYDVLCCKRVSCGHRARLSDLRSATESSSLPGSWYSTSESHVMERYATRCIHLLLKKGSKVLVLVFSAACALGAIVCMEAMDRGLSPISFLPSTSYLHAFYRAVDATKLSRNELPVYFVVEGGYGKNPSRFNSLANDADAQSKFCSSKNICADLSIPTILNALVATGESNVTFFKDSALVSSWLDDFWRFINPGTECCRLDPAHGNLYIPLRAQDRSNRSDLVNRAALYPSCLADASKALTVPPESFLSLLMMFSTADANPLCPFAAGTRYRGQLSVDNRAMPTLDRSVAWNVTLNGTSYGNKLTAFAYKVMSTLDAFPTSRSQEETITAASQARHIATWMSQETGVDVWIYSPDNVFLEQFHSVRRTTCLVVVAGLLLVLGLQSAALGSFWYGFAVTFTAALTVVQVAGFMVPMGVHFNALSIVCLSLAMLLAVDLSGQFTRFFAKARTRSDEAGYLPMGDACVKKVFTELLASWTLGALSKGVAIASLVWAPLPVFGPEGHCFFQLLVAGVVCSCVNSLVLLPVGLSIAVDATDGRVRDVKSTTEEGVAYSRSSPTASYYNAPLSGKC